ncbi:MFS transporter [Flavobacterium sp. NRK F10]|uniref:MFS transporter n=1 Tax=Flavobacterium sp. NRK F10 TaxID=2954931 RepID=UPI0020915C4B|nr:MFS transporter [Flavobacterium sp. NRK F10]MCO6175799.1 MFS transporter [Flavobacterium sp. NRK F10]
MSTSNKQTNWAQFIPLVSVFFFWGFVAASNDILIPVFKKAFDLTNGQSQLVSFAFYIAYTVGALLYMLISRLIKVDIVQKLGYKNSLSLGLLISALGTLLFYPAANTGSFALMLSGLFTVGLGFSLQQTVANPLAIVLGPIATGSQRLTLAGGINNFGTTIGPLIVTYAIFGAKPAVNHVIDIATVKVPYLILGLAFALVAILLKFSSLPNKIKEQGEEEVATVKDVRSSALKYPQLLMGMLAIFVYVGVEVSTASNMPAYLEAGLGMSISEVAPYVSLYWASLMIGRWTGAVEALGLSEGAQKIMKFIMPYIAFGVFLLASYLAGKDLQPFYVYAAVILVLIVADFASKGNPATMLLIFSGLGITALAIGMATSGMVSVYAFTSVGLFCSTLWPCIFTLAISGLGKHTTQGSNFLIMMIMGGGIVSWIQGFVADLTSPHFSYIVGVVCFAYLAFYAYTVKDILTKQGINFDKKVSGGH